MSNSFNDEYDDADDKNDDSKPYIEDYDDSRLLMVSDVDRWAMMVMMMIFRHKYGKLSWYAHQIGQIFAIYNNQTITEN